MTPSAGAAGAAGADPRTDQRRRLERLIALTREALDAVHGGDVDALGTLDARRRDVVLSLRGGASDPDCAALAREARALDAQLVASAVRVRDELGAKVRGLHAVERAQHGYAVTDALGTGIRGA